MIKKRGIIIASILCLCFSNTACSSEPWEAKITIKVVDEEGKPMEGINTEGKRGQATFTEYEIGIFNGV